MDGAPESNPYQSEPHERLDGCAAAQQFAASLGRWQRVVAALLSVTAVLMIGYLAVTVAAGLEALTAILCSGIMISLSFILPSILLWRAAGATMRYAERGSLERLHGLLHGQSVFWRSMGILVLIGIALWVALLAVAIFGVAFLGSTTGSFAG